MMITNKMLAYSISSIGIISLVYKLCRYFYLKNLVKTYFKDKTVLITGASSGLGKTLAEELHVLGAQLILCSKSAELLELVKSNLIKNKGGREPEVLPLDVTSSQELIKSKLDSVLKKYKRIDVLINNAGISFRGESLVATDEVYQKIMDINFFGAVRLTNLVVNKMIEENTDSLRSKMKKRAFTIVNVGSLQSFLGQPFRGPYCASKHAILAYSDSLRAELFAHKNINVVTVHPGYINTNLSMNALTSSGSANNQSDENQKNGFSTQHVAWEIIDAIVARKKEVIVAILLHRLAIWIRFFLPTLYFKIMASRARKAA